MAKTYGQFCPVAQACEVLTERWTPLVLRELMAGSARFTEIQNGVPLMSPSLLSKRLKTLEECGVVRRSKAPDDARKVVYELTRAGEEMRPIIEQLGEWGIRWARGRYDADNLDASLLMWDVRRGIRPSALPGGRTVIHFELRGAAEGLRLWWIVVDAEGIDLCLSPPGFEVDVEVVASLETMTKFWMGDLELADARADGALRVQGSEELTETVGRWLGRNPFAGVPRAT